MQLLSKNKDSEPEPVMVVPEAQHNALREDVRIVIDAYRGLVNSLIEGVVPGSRAATLRDSLDYQARKVLK